MRCSSVTGFHLAGFRLTARCLTVFLLASARTVAGGQGAPPRDSTTKVDTADRAPRVARMPEVRTRWEDTTGLGGVVFLPRTARARTCVGQYKKGGVVTTTAVGAFSGGWMFGLLWYLTDRSLQQNQMVKQGAAIGAAITLYQNTQGGFWMWECDRER
jgi:hypothetical protein